MTTCQQLLVLAVVAALLVPAADTVSLDVRPSGPSGGAAVTTAAAEDESAEVPTGSVDPEISEYQLSAPPGARARGTAPRASARPLGKGQRVLSDALPVAGLAAVGVTWDAGEQVDESAIDVAVRGRTGNGWSSWVDLAYHGDEHGPDAGTREAARATRPGTDAFVLADADRVQVRIDAARRIPQDLRLAVIDPGEAERTTRQEPAIDTAAEEAPARTTDGRVAARVSTTASKPRIFSRRQWGADESLRDKGSLSYGTVKAGFVHHTVNGNGYSKGEVPGIIRSIYAYHTRSLGWSDIGYNYLIDKFGRIWEGRAGGVRRPVIGAHTRGYNHASFGASAIGNFEQVRPRRAMLGAFSRLMAWKLAIHGYRPKGKRRIDGRVVKAISGHRDAGSTACPGRYLYDKLPAIRTRARELQGSFRGRELESDLAGKAYPDLVLRRKSDGRIFLLPIKKRDGRYRAGKPASTNRRFPHALNVWNAGDWDRDGHSDLMTRRPDGRIFLYRGTGTRKFRGPNLIATGAADKRLMAAVGDFTGDGWPDLMGKKKGGSFRLWPGKGLNGLRKPIRAYGKVNGRRQIATGRWNRGGAPDTFIRGKHKLWVYHGNGPGGLVGRQHVPVAINNYDWFVAVSDVDRSGGHADVIARQKGTNRLFILRGRWDGGLRSPVPLGRRVASGVQAMG